MPDQREDLRQRRARLAAVILRLLELGPIYGQKVVEVIRLKKRNRARLARVTVLVEKDTLVNKECRIGKNIYKPPVYVGVPATLRKAIDTAETMAAEGRLLCDEAIDLARREPAIDRNRIVGNVARLRSWWAQDDEPYHDYVVQDRPLADYLTDLAKDLTDLEAAAHYGAAEVWRRTRWFTRTTDGKLNGDVLRKMHDVLRRPVGSRTGPKVQGRPIEYDYEVNSVIAAVRPEHAKALRAALIG